MSLVTSLFFLVLLLNQRSSPPLRLQASHSVHIIIIIIIIIIINININAWKVDPPSPLVSHYRGFFGGAKSPGSETNNSSTSSPEVKNGCSFVAGIGISLLFPIIIT
jgi:hypothetical protein